MNSLLLINWTLFTTFVCLGFTLWFAIYLLSRTHSNYLTFRAIVALIALAFYYNSALNAQITSSSEQSQIRSLTTIIALIACHDLTHYLLSPKQRKKLYAIARGIVMFGVIIIILIFTAPMGTPCDPEYVCPTTLSYPWLIIDLFKVLIFCFILYNLWLIRQSASLLRNTAFYLAILTGLGAVGYGLLGTALNLALPRILPNLIILGSLILLAYSVAHDRTLVTRRVSIYDLPITLLTIIVIVVIYILAGIQLKLPVNELLLIAVLAIFTHSGDDFVKDYLDHLVNRREHAMRQELHTLGRIASEGQSLERYLNRGLAILCINLRASCGFIAIHQVDHYVVVASLHSLPVGSPFPSKEVVFEGLAEPTNAIFHEIAWLVPSYTGNEQIAVIGLGLRKDKTPYSEEDLYWLEDIAQEMGQIIHLHEWHKSATIQRSLSKVSSADVITGRPIDQDDLFSAFAYKPDAELVKCIEEGYRHLHDYDYLGKSALVSLFSIQGNDHIECGKAVHAKLIQILEKLRPADQPPTEPIPSEWYAYTILHDSYVTERLSREIMAKLYIGEGTYYRLRRQALRGITRALVEMGAVAEFVGSN
jgi:hypothetical protein